MKDTTKETVKIEPTPSNSAESIDTGKHTIDTVYNPLDPPKMGSKAPEQIVSEKSDNEMIRLEVNAHNDTHSINITRIVAVSEISKCIDDTIAEISKSKTFEAKPVNAEIKTPPVILSPLPQESPVRSFAEKIEVDPDAFEKLKLIAIKNDAVQLLKPTKLKPTESCYLLLAVNEFALGKQSMQFEDWRELCQASNIKSPTPIYKIASNAKNAGHIDKKKYTNTRELVLSPKGVEIVRKAIEKAISEN